LCEQLQGSTAGVTVLCRVENVEVLTQQAVTIGLLVNELVTNAIKYAYDDHGGVVNVEICSAAERQLVLSVEDQGKGLPEDFDAVGRSSLGLKLITSLSRQLGGEPRWERPASGTRFAVTFMPAFND
jgi:two-component sensor histidine kinase